MLISFFDDCGVDYSCNISLSSVFTYVFFSTAVCGDSIDHSRVCSSVLHIYPCVLKEVPGELH